MKRETVTQPHRGELTGKRGGWDGERRSADTGWQAGAESKHQKRQAERQVKRRAQSAKGDRRQSAWYAVIRPGNQRHVKRNV